MSGSHVPNETLEPCQIRVSKIRVSTHHTPLSIIPPDVSSSWKHSNSSNVSLIKSFHHLSANVHQPLYPDLFAEGSALAIVSNVFYCLLANTVFQHMQSNDTFQSPIWKGAIA